MFTASLFKSQKLETQSFNWQMGKQIGVYPYNRVLTSNKKEWTMGPLSDMDESQKHAKWKKSHSKGYILYDSAHTTFYKRQNYRELKTNQWLPGLGLEGAVGLQSDMSEFPGVMKLFSIIITKRNASVKTHRIVHLKNDAFYCFSKRHLRGKDDPFTYSCTGREIIIYHKISSKDLIWWSVNWDLS